MARDLQARLALLRQYDDIVNFHKKFDLMPYPYFGAMPKSLIEFRQNFLAEEASEIREALYGKDKPALLDGLIDLAYVAMGTYYLAGHRKHPLRSYVADPVGVLGLIDIADDNELTANDHASFLINTVCSCRQEAIGMGFNFDLGWDRVQHANMQKVRAKSIKDGKRGSTWDVVKPEGWLAPIMEDLV